MCRPITALTAGWRRLAPTLRSLDLSHTLVVNLAPLAELSNLNSLHLIDAPRVDVNSLNALEQTNLKIYMTEWANKGKVANLLETEH